MGPSSPGPYEKAFTDALGKESNDYMTSVPWYDPSCEITKKVLAQWTKATPNNRFELNSGFGWEGIQVVADAFKRAGSTKPSDLHAALKATNIAEHPMAGGADYLRQQGSERQYWHSAGPAELEWAAGGDRAVGIGRGKAPNFR